VEEERRPLPFKETGEVVNYAVAEELGGFWAVMRAKWARRDWAKTRLPMIAPM
jgi:hypothetical protein